MVVLPKHIMLPEIPGDGNLYFEVILYIFGVVIMGLQYVNMYKTVWWLPHSNANYALVSLSQLYLVILIFDVSRTVLNKVTLGNKNIGGYMES